MELHRLPLPQIQGLLQAVESTPTVVALAPLGQLREPEVRRATREAEEGGIPQHWRPLERLLLGDLQLAGEPLAGEGALQRGPPRRHGVLGSSRPSLRGGAPLRIQQGAPTKEIAHVLVAGGEAEVRAPSEPDWGQKDNKSNGRPGM